MIYNCNKYIMVKVSASLHLKSLIAAEDYVGTLTGKKLGQLKAPIIAA